jgi:hypothetical protein
MAFRANTIKLAAKTPDLALFNTAESSNEFAIQRREKEYYVKKRNRTYGQGDVMEFVIHDGTAFIDLDNSYLKGTVTFASSGEETALLEQNGLHSLFKSWAVYNESTRTLLSKENMYNLRTAQTNPLRYSQENLDELKPGECCGYEKDGWIASGDGWFNRCVSAANVVPLYHDNAVFWIDTGVATPNLPISTNAEHIFTVDSVDDATDTFVATSNDATWTIAPGAIDGYKVYLYTNQDGKTKLEMIDLHNRDAPALSSTAGGAGGQFTGVLPITASTNLQPGSKVVILNSVVSHTPGFVERGSSLLLSEKAPLSAVDGSALGDVDTEIHVLYRGDGYIVHNSHNNAVDAFYLFGDSVVHAAPPSRVEGMRRRCGGSISFPFTLKIDLGIMRTKHWFPLFLMSKGLALEGRIENNIQRTCFQSLPCSVLQNVQTHSVTFSDLKFVAVLYNTIPLVNRNYMEMYDSGRLLFPFVEYDNGFDHISGGIGRQLIECRTTARSVRHVLARLTTPELFSESGIVNRYNRPLSIRPSLGLTKYCFKWSGFEYPEFEVSMNGDYSAENLRRLRAVYQQLWDNADTESRRPNVYAQSRVRLAEADRRPFLVVPDANNYTELIRDTDACLMVAVCSRDDQSMFAGIDTQLEPLYLSCNFGEAVNSSLGSYRLIQMFTARDVYLRISSDGVSRLS